MHGFDAVNHAMTTISTGGYSTSDGSMGHFSTFAHWNAIVFMFLGGLPFLLLIRAVTKKSLKPLWQDAQIIGFLKLVLFCALSLSIYLIVTHQFSWLDAIRLSLFNVVSVVTTTGFGLDDFLTWGGSTAGGIKIFRFQIAFALLKRQLMLLMHPHALFPQKYNNRNVSDEILRSLIAFVMAYIATIVAATLLLALFGSPAMTALTASITAVSNVGPGLVAEIGPSGNFAALPNASKWVLSICMLMGRLEILTVAVMLTRHFWRR